MITGARRPRPSVSRLLTLGLVSALLVGLAGLASYASTGIALAHGVRTSTSTALAHGARTSTSTTLRIWYATDDPTERPWARELVQRYAAGRRSVNVALSIYGLDVMNDKMQLALGAGNPPDLVYTTPRGPGLPAYVRAGKLLDLSAAARHANWAGALRPGLLAGYNSLLAANGGSRDSGKTYAVPYDMAAVGVLYNKTLFDTLHLAVPRTLADFNAVCARVKRAGLTPIGLGNADGWVGDDLYLTLANALAGPSSLTPELSLSPSFSFKGAPFRQAAQTLQGWSQNNYFTHEFGGLDAQDAVEAFFAGRTAMQLVSSSENSQILSHVHDKGVDVGIFPFPSAKKGQRPVMPQSGYAGWAVPTRSRNVAAATDFITYVTSAQTARLLLAHGMVPAHPVDTRSLSAAAPFQRDYIAALDAAEPGVYLDSAPIPNINATMEANVQLLLQNVEAPGFLVRSLQDVYASRGAHASSTRTDGEF